jgi:hypothetical protein
MRPRNDGTLLPNLPLLITESADEFDALRDAFEREIKPRAIIEQMYVHDICSIVWEILRLRRKGGHHQFGLPQCIGASSRAAFKGARPVWL